MSGPTPVLLAAFRHQAFRHVGGGHGWWLVLAVLLLALLILAVGALLVAGRPTGRSEVETPLIPPEPPSPAEQILAQRLARGEIDVEEYRRRRDTLRG